LPSEECCGKFKGDLQNWLISIDSMVDFPSRVKFQQVLAAFSRGSP
jgi:hypothetical protein